MPPKPFKPPRPAGASSKSKSTTPKPRTSTDGITKKPRAPYGSKTNIDSAKKASRASYGSSKKAREEGSGSKERVSAGSRLSFAGLPSLSSDSGAELDDDEDRDSGKALSRSKSITNDAQSESELDDDNDVNSPAHSDSAAFPIPEIEESKQEPAIPVDLLNVLLHQFYKNKDTKMSKDANAAVGRYMETFCREAIARVAYAKEQDSNGVGGVMEVEDLEKVAVQLIYDF